MRRDSLHATINNLPDPNYATLRALTLVSNIDKTRDYVRSLTDTSIYIVFKSTPI